ncbi:MAG: hypothetical protein HC918_07275 [Oscillatoriales cyanobacterium SM2_1_8]|nr:hypothetical protein [Oscillatoriales cyanobacterium SM2_1_8]
MNITLSGGGLNSGTGDITLTGDTIGVAATPNTLTGAGNLTFRPFTSGYGVSVGTSGVPGVLELAPSVFSGTGLNFAQTTIGSGTTGAIALGTVTIPQPNVTFQGTQTNLNGNATFSFASPHAITFNTPTVSVVGDSQIRVPNAGDLRLAGNVTGANDLTLQAAGNVLLGGSVNLGGGFTVLPSNRLDLGGNIVASSVNLQAPVALAATTSIEATASNLFISAPITSAVSGAGLTLQANDSININANIALTNGLLQVLADTDGDNDGDVSIFTANLTTGGGDFVARGGSNSPFFPGLALGLGSQIQTGGGKIELTGTNTATAISGGTGINLSGASTLDSGGGEIVLNGTGTSGAGISIFESTVTSGAGAVGITGVATADGRGLEIADSQITSTVGNINVSGTGRFAAGLEMVSSSVQSGSGAIALSGINDGGSNGYDGVILTGSTVQTGGSGTIAVTGTGAPSASRGISLDTTTLEAQNGDISVVGVSRSSAGAFPLAEGVQIGSGSQVVTTGTGTITLEGSTDSTGSRGVQVSGQISTTNREISLVSTTGGIDVATTGNVNAGSGDIGFATDTAIDIRGTNTVLTTGNVSLASQTPNRSLSLGVPLPDTLQIGVLSGLGAGIDQLVLDSGTGTITSNGFSVTPDVRFTGSEFRTEGAPTVGSGDVVVAGPARLTANLQATTGDIELTGNVVVAGANVAVQSGSGGELEIVGNVNGAVPGANNLTLEGGDIDISGNLGAGTRLGDVVINSEDAVSLNQVQSSSLTVDAQTIVLTGAVNTSGGSGVSLIGFDIDIEAPLTATGSGGLSITNDGLLTIADGAPIDVAGNLTQVGSGSIQVAGNLRAGGNIVWNSPVAMTGDTEFLAGGALGIAFNGGLNAGGNDLTLGSEELDFGAPLTGVNSLTVQPFTATRPIVVGGSFNVPGSLTLTDLDLINIQASGLASLNIGNQASGNISFVSSFPAFSQNTTFAAGNGATITAATPIFGSGSGSLTFDGGGNVTLADVTNPGNDITAISRNGNIDTTGGTLSSVGTNSGDIALQAPNGGIALGTITTEATTGNAGSLSLTAAQPLTLASSINLSAPSGNGGNFTADIPVNLLNFTVIFTAGSGIGGNITFDQGIAGSEGLSLNAGSGNINLNGTVAVNDLFLRTAGTIRLGGNVTTTFGQTYSGNVVLTQNAVLTAGNFSGIRFEGNVDGDRSLTLNAGTANVFFQGVVGGSTRLSNLTVNPEATVSSSAGLVVRTTGDIRTGNIDNQGFEGGFDGDGSPPRPVELMPWKVRSPLAISVPPTTVGRGNRSPSTRTIRCR